MSRQQPLDLRLLPAALVAWAVALLTIRLSWEVSAGLGALLMAMAVVAASAALLLLARGRSSSRRQGLGIEICVHLVISLLVAAGVSLSAAGSLRHIEQTGWNEAAESAAPVAVTLRMGEDPQETVRRSFSGEPQSRARVTILHMHSGTQKSARISAEARLLGDAEELEHLRSGHRYQLRVSTSALPPEERTTALLFPFGKAEFTQLPADAWTQGTEVFSALRRATVELSQSAWADGSALLPGVVLGDRSGQEEDLTEAMQISGLTHMTVVSGTHCSLMLGAVLGLARLFRMPRGLTPVLCMVALVFFVMLVEPAPSVIRAAVMGSIGALAVFAGRGRASSALLCLCVVILLLADPWYAGDAAFQLSVAATIGIVLVGQQLRELFSRVMPDWVAAPLALAASAQLFITVVLLPLSEGITVYSVPVNVLAGPLLPLAVVPGLLAAVLSVTFPVVSQALLWVAGFPAAGIGLLGRATASLPGALAPWPTGPLGWALVGLYLAAAVVVAQLLIVRRRPRILQMSVLIAAAASMVALILAPLLTPGARLPDDWRLALCDVGQGDMLVIRTGEDTGIVWDTGEEPQAATECITGLQLRSVEMMISHEHFDHYGGASGVIDSVEVSGVLHGGSAQWDPRAEDAFEALGNVPVVRAQVGDGLGYAGRYPVDWEVLVADSHHPNPNDNSMVVVFEIHPVEQDDAAASLRLLAMGDMEEEVTSMKLASQQLPAAVDVLQVPHHGAANASTELMEFTSPAVALIGVGEENSYGHPAPETLQTLEDVEATVFRTDLHGSVVFTLTEQGMRSYPLR